MVDFVKTFGLTLIFILQHLDSLMNHSKKFHVCSKRWKSTYASDKFVKLNKILFNIPTHTYM